MILVRHGKSAVPWHLNQDAPLSRVGIEQASRLVQMLPKPAEPGFVISSPLIRCVQTATPLARMWNVDVTIDDDFNEIPHPGDYSSEKLHCWLQSMIALPIAQYDEQTTAWGQKMLSKIMKMRAESIIFTHFFNINFIVCSLLQTPNSQAIEIPHCVALDISPSENSISCRIH